MRILIKSRLTLIIKELLQYLHFTVVDAKRPQTRREADSSPAKGIEICQA